MSTRMWFVLMIVLLSCKDNSVDIVRLGVKQTIELNLNYLQQKDLSLSDSTNNSRIVSVKFIDVQEGRCSQDQCMVCYGGQAKVKVLVSSGLRRDTLTFRRLSCIYDDIPISSPAFVKQSVQGINMGLSNMSGISKSLKDYSIKLLINEQ